MSTRSKTRSPAQSRMAKIITMYVQYLMDMQEQTERKTKDAVMVHQVTSFPSFDFFCAEFVPVISVDGYANRLVTYMRCSPEAYIFALAYIRRLHLCGFPLHSRSIHRVLLTAIVVAAKTRDDLYCSMNYYAQVGGVSNRDLNMMEIRFLVDLIEFRAEVLPEEYRIVCNAITTADSIKRVGSSGSDLCGPTVSNTPTESDKTHSASETNWISECQIYW